MKRNTGDRQLVQAAAKGNLEAFDHLVRRYFGMVYAIGFSRLGCRESAEDLAQEVFVRAYLRLDALEKPNQFGGWLVRVAQNLATDWARSQRRSSYLVTMIPLADLQSDLPDKIRESASDRLLREERDQMLRNAIFGLPLEQREAILLHFMEGLSQKEVAKRLAVHPATIGRHLKAALRSMRLALEPSLREAFAGIRPSREASARAMAAAGVLAGLSAAARSALAAAADASLQLHSGSALNGLASGPLFFPKLWSIMVTGGKLMATGKGLASLIMAASLAGAGSYYIHTRGSAQAPFPAPGAAAAANGNPAPMQPEAMAGGITYFQAQMLGGTQAPSPTPEPTPVTYPALKGKRVYDAVSQKRRPQNAALLDDVQRVAITEKEKHLYSDDGNSLGDDAASDGIFSQRSEDSTREMIGGETHAYLRRTVNALRQAERMDPLEFTGLPAMTTEEFSQVPSLRSKQAELKARIASKDTNGQISGWAVDFLRDYRTDPADPRSRFYSLHIPLSPVPPAIQPPPGPWKPYGHPELSKAGSEQKQILRPYPGQSPAGSGMMMVPAMAASSQAPHGGLRRAR